MQQHLLGDRQDYGPLINSGRTSPRVVQVGSMLLQLDDTDTPLAPPSAPPTQERTVMGTTMRKSCRSSTRKHDEVAFLNAQRNYRDVVIQNAKAHFRTAEAALQLESQQIDVAISMAREVAIGQYVVLV